MKRLLACFSLVLLCFATSVLADPPSKVARLSYIEGAVTYSSTANNKWSFATLNRPLITGDRIWTDKQGRAEIQLGSAVVRINTETNLGILNFNQRLAQIQLTQGTINLSVRKNAGITYEINTPHLALVINKPGDYRLDVSRMTTNIAIHGGQAIVYGKTASYRLKGQMAYSFMGNNLNPYQMTKLPRLDLFDKWAKKRDQRFLRSSSVRYVSPNMVGYEDLDSYGNWEATNSYGHVWRPSHVPANWAPYRYGHWEWIAPWGWTWIDNQSWGFAPFHYGRWIFINRNWAWVPGPRHVEPVYAPALVAFIKIGNVRISIGSRGEMGWIPLGPRDVYVPPYAVSRNYFTNVNVTNTTIVNNTYVTNIYNNQTTVINYQNRQAADAVTVVPKDIVVAAKPIAPAIMPISKDVIDKTAFQPIVKPVEPTPLSQPTSKFTDIQPPKAIELAPVIVKTPTEPVVTGDKDKPAEIIVPTKPIAEIQPLPIKPLEPTIINNADKSADKPKEELKPLEPAKPIEPEVKPIETLGPTEASKPIETLEPVETLKPIAPPKKGEEPPMLEPIKESDNMPKPIDIAPQPPTTDEPKKIEPLQPEPLNKPELAQAEPVEALPAAPPTPVETMPAAPAESMPAAPAAPVEAEPAPMPTPAAPVEVAPAAPVEAMPAAPAAAAPMEVAPPAPAPVEVAPPAPAPVEATPAPMSAPVAPADPAQAAPLTPAG